MAVENKDIIVLGSTEMPDDDVTTQIGGALASAHLFSGGHIKCVFADLVNTGTCKVVSENSGDTTQTLTVYGRNTAGEKINEGIGLNGTTPATGSTSFERLMNATKSATCAGVVAAMSTTNDHTGTADAGGADYIDLQSTASDVDEAYQFKVIRITNGTGAGQLREIVSYDGTLERAYVRNWTTNPDATSLYEIADGMLFEKTPLEISEVRRIFYDAAANPAGGAEKTLHEKVFIYNLHATLALTNATIAEVAEGLSTSIAFDLESTLGGSDDNGSGNARTVAPAGYTFDSATKDVANSQNFSPSSAQGTWLELTLAAGAAAVNSFYKLQTQGQSV